MKRLFCLVLLMQLIIINSCGQHKSFDLKNYSEVERGAITIDNVPIDNTIFLKNVNDTNYTASVTYEDSTYSQAQSIFFYYKGVATGPFKTFVDGKLFRIGSYKNGKRDGEFIEYGNGYITNKKYFKDGLKVGVWKEYNQDGTIKRKTTFGDNQIIEDIKY